MCAQFYAKQGSMSARTLIPDLSLYCVGVSLLVELIYSSVCRHWVSVGNKRISFFELCSIDDDAPAPVVKTQSHKTKTTTTKKQFCIRIPKRQHKRNRHTVKEWEIAVDKSAFYEIAKHIAQKKKKKNTQRDKTNWGLFKFPSAWKRSFNLCDGFVRSVGISDWTSDDKTKWIWFCWTYGLWKSFRSIPHVRLSVEHRPNYTAPEKKYVIFKWNGIETHATKTNRPTEITAKFSYEINRRKSHQLTPKTASKQANSSVPLSMRPLTRVCVVVHCNQALQQLNKW